MSEWIETEKRQEPRWQSRGSVETGQARRLGTLRGRGANADPTRLPTSQHPESSEDFKREEFETTGEASERSEIEPREELLFRGMSKSETKGNNGRKEQLSLVKQSKNAMISSISPRDEQTSSKAKKSWKSLYDERMASLQTEGLANSDVDFTPNPMND